MFTQIKAIVEQCPECAKYSKPHCEPMISSTLPDYPWQKIGSDLFQLKGTTYLLVVDYFSRYPEIVKLTSTTSGSIISALRSIFSRYGIPEVMLSDNGPQYSSQEMKDFASSYGFIQVTSSPHYQQSNGLAERMVRTMKELLKKSEDPYLALLSYRTTPFPWCNFSPAELLMGRQIWNNMPQIDKHLVPKRPYLSDFKRKDAEFKKKQEENYNKSHRARPLGPISENTKVWVTTGDHLDPGKVISRHNAPRSYVVETPKGEVRGNRQHLTEIPESMDSSSNIQEPYNNPPEQEHGIQSRSPIQTRSKTGTSVLPPDRLSY